MAVAEHLVVLRPQLLPLTNATICRNISAGQFMALIEVRGTSPCLWLQVAPERVASDMLSGLVCHHMSEDLLM